MKHFLRPYIARGVVILSLASVWSAGLEAQGLRLKPLSARVFLLLHSQSNSYLGVDFVDVDQDKAQALHLGQARGAEITILDHDAPAGKAGLRQHDVIVEFNGKAIENADALKLALHHTPIGRKVQLVVSRDGVRITVNTQMADRRKMQEEARKEIDGGSSSGLGKGFLAGGSTDSSSSGGFHILGMGNSLKVGALVEPLSPQMADFLGVTSGLMIKSVAHKSAAYAAGLEPHDVILAVGGETVLSSSDWERLLRASEGKPVQVEILRDRTKQLVLLSVDGMRH